MASEPRYLDQPLTMLTRPTPSHKPKPSTTTHAKPTKSCRFRKTPYSMYTTSQIPTGRS